MRRQFDVVQMALYLMNQKGKKGSHGGHGGHGVAEDLLPGRFAVRASEKRDAYMPNVERYDLRS